ncbi:MAG: hypothetical protein ABSE81_06995 [Candidatus Omnitrophota bacterium]|jgi:hypothetical protein
MNKLKVLGLVTVTIMFCSVIAFAQDSSEKKELTIEEKTNEKQIEKERMGGMVMQMMGTIQKQIVATNDGGVIVMAGNKLFKYDKDLNFVKEVELKTAVELKVDAGSMQEMIKSMKEKYGKHGKMTQGESQETEKK